MINVYIDNENYENGEDIGIIRNTINNIPNSTVETYLRQIDMSISDSLILGLGTEGNSSVLVFVCIIDPKGHKEIYNFRPNVSFNTIYSIYVIIGGERWEKEYYRDKYNYLLGLEEGNYDYAAIRYIIGDHEGYPFVPSNDEMTKEYLDGIGYDESKINIIRFKYSRYIYDLIDSETFGIIDTYFRNR
ncbi:Hypothetical protein ORPV_518 [Orpheovirus IHUMI-LCC2]|uniref:Uncharacterized protein n=1 Tax=Orpheovirus IHUMI-LCC2 TaxID=2023057 RepID=A0A2I2L4E8_9VIRU|nr:Hypothetical protein ORPV_518 [Orpheovirus IHUMI-LCC2]SNW62422.1 Hypothetical protein ORPV_518 [Orpheovirus IHUMI-LCC2]